MARVIQYPSTAAPFQVPSVTVSGYVSGVIVGATILLQYQAVAAPIRPPLPKPRDWYTVYDDFARKATLPVACMPAYQPGAAEQPEEPVPGKIPKVKYEDFARARTTGHVAFIPFDAPRDLRIAASKDSVKYMWQPKYADS